MVNHSFVDSDKNDVGGFGKTPWRINPKFPLGTIFDGGAHDFAILTQIFGMPESLYAVSAKMREEMGEYDYILTTLKFSNQLSGIYSHSGFLNSNQNYFIIRFEQAVITVKEGNLTIAKSNGDTEQIKFEKIATYKEMWIKLAKNYFDKTDSDFPVDLAAKNLSIYDAIEKSLNNNQVISI